MESPEQVKILASDPALKANQDLLTQQWSPITSSTDLNSSINDGENNGFLMWENCQDLTDWCMDSATLPTEYDFHTGESATTRNTVTQYLGRDASDLGKGLMTLPINVEEEAIPNFSPPNIELPAVKKEIEDDLFPVTPGGWLDLPALDLPVMGSQVANKNQNIANTHTSSGIEVQDAIDILRNINVGNDKFDLISYLYEEESGTSATSSPCQNVKQDALCYRSDDCQSSYSSSTSVSIVDPLEKALTETTNNNSNDNRRQTRRIRKRKYEDDDDYIEETPCIKYKRNRNDSSRSRSVSEPHQESYRESREKNNEASRKSRMNKKAKEMEMMLESEKLEKENRILKMKVEQLEKLVITMRKTLLESALSRRYRP